MTSDLDKADKAAQSLLDMVNDDSRSFTREERKMVFDGVEQVRKLAWSMEYLNAPIMATLVGLGFVFGMLFAKMAL